MLQRTAAFMKKHQMAQPGEKVVLGLSGGMDSVCLFYLLKDLGYALEAVHVHHGIRGEEADRDEQFVKKLCETHKIPFHSFHFDVPALSKEQHFTEEEAGRMVRKQAFSEVLEKSGARWIALAHHGNDRAETFLFHLIRGTGVRGLGSMKPVFGNVMRPLLWADRETIAGYVKAMKYDYVEDHTNQLDEYTRNRIRHQVLPVLEEINPKAVAHIGSAAEKLGRISAYMDREAKKHCDHCARLEEGQVFLEKSAFLEGDEVLLVPVLQLCVGHLSGSLANVTEEHFQALLALFKMQTGKEVHLPYGIVAVRTYEGIRLFFREETKGQEPLKITGEGCYRFGELEVLVSVEPWDESKIFPIKTYTKCFDYDKINKELFLRNRESGDYLEINQAHGRKSLQDYLVNEKVPKEERDQTVLLADGNHILWVVGKRISEYYKVTEKTKTVLKVQVCGGNGYV